jgi:type II secretory ATPase GspE/PulE/Tfp pilus assembly ATPase PilB-like protein
MPYTPNADLLAQLGVDPARGKDLTFYEGKGCPACNDTGYRGRLALYEVLEMDDDLSDAAIKGLSNQEIKAIARRNGMMTLRDSGIAKIMEGITTVSEVVSVTFEN